MANIAAVLLAKMRFIKIVGVTPLTASIGYDEWWVKQTRNNFYKGGMAFFDAEKKALEDYAKAKALAAGSASLTMQQSIANVALRNWFDMKFKEVTKSCNCVLTPDQQRELRIVLLQSIGFNGVANQIASVHKEIEGDGIQWFDYCKDKKTGCVKVKDVMYRGKENKFKVPPDCDLLPALGGPKNNC